MNLLAAIDNEDQQGSVCITAHSIKATTVSRRLCRAEEQPTHPPNRGSRLVIVMSASTLTSGLLRSSMLPRTRQHHTDLAALRLHLVRSEEGPVSLPQPTSDHPTDTNNSSRATLPSAHHHHLVAAPAQARRMFSRR